MKCPSCHAPLMIEEEYCRYCGKENPYFTQHREDLKEFTEEFEKTHKKVLKQVKHFNRAATNLALVCALLLLNIFALGFIANIADMGVAYKKWQVNHHENSIRATLEAYSDAGDVLGMAEYMNKQLGVALASTNLRDYYAVENAADIYTDVYNGIVYLTVLQEQSPTSIDDLCVSISGDLVLFYDAITQKSYQSADGFNEEHTETFAMMESHMEAMLESLLNIPPEEIPALLELSETRRALAIEEGVFGNEP